MAYAPRSEPRRAMALALLATTAMAALLGGCNQTGSPFARSGASEAKLSTSEAVGAVSQWSAAYAKKPQDPKTALGYAMALKAIGSRDRALEVLTVAYRTTPDNGEVAAELGRLALDMGRLDIAKQTLKVAEAQGVRDWKTLSAQGTLRAKQGQHAEAQQYFLSALQKQPDAVSVINNLALSYALDGKADKSEELLRKAVASGHEDKRLRQNLALVLGLQGKFEEARRLASVDMTQEEAKTSMSYLRNMLSNQTQIAAGDADDGADDWQPFAHNDGGDQDAPNRTAAATPSAPAKVQMVKVTEEVEAPSAAKTSPAAKSGKLAGTPTLITPVNATPAQIKAVAPVQGNTSAAPKAPPAASSAGAAGLLRTDTD